MACFSGQCYCGSVKFEVKADIQYMSHCHCKQCQIIHGAPFATWVGFYTKEYELAGPIKFYQTQHARRGFCSECGSNILFQYTDPSFSHYVENEIAFARPCFNEKISFNEAKHIFMDEQADWFKFKDHLPKRNVFLKNLGENF